MLVYSNIHHYSKCQDYKLNVNWAGYSLNLNKIEKLPSFLGIYIFSSQYFGSNEIFSEI